ncbi:hypothetical protein B0O99DRAFT_747902 [Bisporella sp. PMI_857]|nr:hypothetical protein B0O99DRAFT_747902 [Bisporella sp. PMI_857]
MVTITEALPIIDIDGPESIHHRPKQRQPRQVYKCSFCGRLFKRSEHCVRHERGHTNTKPFPCEFCGRHYARKDLVTRHVQSFHPNGNAERLHNSAVRHNSSSSSGSPQEEGSTAGQSPSHAVTNDPSTINVAIPQLSDNENSTEQNSLSPRPSQLETTTNNHPSLASPASITFHETLPPYSPHDAALNNYIPHDSTHSQDDELSNRSAQRNRENVSVQDNCEEGLSLVNDMAQITAQYDNHWQHLEGQETGFGASEDIDFTRVLPSSHVYGDGQSQDIDFFALLAGSTPNINLDFSAPSRQFDVASHPIMEDHTSEDFSQTEPGAGQQENFESTIVTGIERPSSAKSDQSLMNDSMYAKLREDVRTRLVSGGTFTLPSAAKLRQFMKCYLSCFHDHFPILHWPSMEANPLYTPLILAISAIGALYKLKRTVAKDLWEFAESMVEPDCRRKNLVEQTPIQALQAKLLLTIFAVFGGHVQDVVASTQNLGFWAAEYRLRRASLARQGVEHKRLSWSEWTSRETVKRLLCGIFVLGSLLTVTYDTTPFLTVTQDLNIEIPEREIKWKAQTAEDWEHVAFTHHNNQLPTVRDVLAHLIFHRCPSSYRTLANDRTMWSGFAITVVMHAVNIHMWHIMQCTQSFTGFPIEPSTIGHEMVLQIEQSLARCYTLLTTHQPDVETPEPGEGPQLFNCQALLRSAYVRIFTGAGSFDRLMLLSEDDDQIAYSIQNFVHSQQPRSPFLTKAVSKAYVGLLTPITAGYLLVRRTAALTWSVEHAIAAWDCALFVTKWIHGIETNQSTPRGAPDIAEAENIAKFRELLLDAESDYERTESLAADVAHVWADFLDDTWVWGITPRMGHLLRLLSKAYLKDRNISTL